MLYVSRQIVIDMFLGGIGQAMWRNGLLHLGEAAIY